MIGQPLNRQQRSRGFTMIELMISITIGSIILVGTVLVFQQSRAAYLVNDATSRLQENARFALDILDPDVRLASYWGATNRAEFVDGQKDTPLQLPAVAGDCADRWYIDFRNSLNGINGTSVIGAVDGSNAPLNGCIPNAQHLAGTDVLVVRHASEQPQPPQAGRVQIQSDPLNAMLFTGGVIPGGFSPPPASNTFALTAHAYYISPDSIALGAGIPSLRRITLVDGPAIEDQEIIAGVEDFQVQFGIDTDADLDANRYINADNALITPGSPSFDPNLQIVAVRIWLRFRSVRSEVGFVDDTAYQYADVNDPAPNDAFRRLLISKTIHLRNTRLRS
ncbi:MAG: PilW family protein [Gammaproteobacteria bacterium]|nr:PilW family protein [Gammaproteobacteria bacterium]